MSLAPMLSPARIAEMARRQLWPNRLLCDYLDDAAARAPEAVAIVDHNSLTGSETRVTYGELAAISIRLACALDAHGVGHGDVVAVQLPNWWHYAALYCACNRIGAVINPLMPIFRERELEFMLGFAAAKVLVVAREFRGFAYPEMIATLRPQLPALQHVFVVDGDDPATAFETCLLERAWENETDSAALFASRRPDPDDVSEIMYTSGTTGQPKGVMHSNNTLLCKALLARELFDLAPDDVIFMGSPLAHQTGFMYATVLSIFNAGKCVLQDVWEPVAAAARMAAERCTITLGSTPFLSDLVRTAGVQEYDTSALRLFLCAGAPIPSALVEEARTVHPGLYVMSAWGMTEMGIATATYPGDPLDKVINTDGRALPHQAVRVVDDDGQVVAAGVEGRLQSNCATTFIGYLKRPEDYGVDADFWFETGDNARMDSDGYIRITGRSKDIIIRGGENIPVVEVEELIFRHPQVEDVAIVAMPDARLGERACAFVTLRDAADLDLAAVTTYLAGCKLARQYWPERIEVLDAFPRTPSGKIQKFRLREIASTLTPERP